MPETAMPRMFVLRSSDIRRAADRAASSYDSAAVLQAEILDRLLERIQDLEPVPDQVLDVGSATGRATQTLAMKFDHARTVALDLSLNMLAVTADRCAGMQHVRLVAGDAGALPFNSGAFDLVVSSLLLHWCNDIPAALGELRRVLKPGGRLLFSLYGRDTLKELRAAWAAVDGYTHVNYFHDMHDIGDMAIRIGLTELVVDVDTFTLTYSNVEALVRDLRNIGAGNVTAGRRRGLAGRDTKRRLIENYETWRDGDRLPATVEVIYGYALAPATGSVVATDGEVRVPLSDITRRRG